jgi:hypothetical protein
MIGHIPVFICMGIKGLSSFLPLLLQREIAINNKIDNKKDMFYASFHQSKSPS